MNAQDPEDVIRDADNQDPTVTDFDFDVWLQSGTITHQVVPIYMDQEAVEELEAIGAEIEALATEDSGPEVLTDTAIPEDIEKRWLAAMERYEASRTDFTLSPIDRDTIRDVWEIFPNPEPPANPSAAKWPIGKNAPDRQRIIDQRIAAEKSYQERKREWALEVDRLEAERVVSLLAASITKVATPTATADGLTVAQLRALRDAPYGVPRLNRLWAGYERVMRERGEPSRPTLPGASGSDRA